MTSATVRPPLMSAEEYDAFYAAYSQNVEGFYEAAYWRLCDEIIRALIRRHLEIGPGDAILDAGGGTGRWARWCHETLGVRVTIADRSRAMLEQARRGLEANGHGDAISLLECDLQTTRLLPPDAFAGAISTYNMLSFVDDPGAALGTIAASLRPGATALIMGQAYGNALSSKLSLGQASPQELRELADSGVVKWAPHVPRLRVFSARELRALMQEAGFEVAAVYGVTCLVVPGPDDFTYPYEQLSAVSTALEDPEVFRCALELELRVNAAEGFADRGVNLLVVGRRLP
jgi:ubiquinone/menaquinone biosynthesis C-methylase UbiE